MRQIDGTEALQRVRALRSSATEAEKLLWGKLRSGRLGEAKFRRQVWIGPYIADFYCHAAKLVVEIDGSHHNDQVEYDSVRSQFLSERGLRVLRFWNNGVLQDLNTVLEAIRAELNTLVPSPSHFPPESWPLPLPNGRG